jgi:hypothetical protein
MKTPMQQLLEEVTEEIEGSISVEFVAALGFVKSAIEQCYIHEEKEAMCDFVDYVYERRRAFEDGDINPREYESYIDEMFERRYREGGTKLSPKEERFWKEVDELRKERDEKRNELLKTNEK